MLIKTGQLAKRAGILPSKVRFYVREGILQPVSQTPGGYCLFDGQEAIERLREIDALQEQAKAYPYRNQTTLGSRGGG